MSIDEIEYFGGGPHGSPSPTTMLVSLSQCSHFHLIGVTVLGFAKNRQRRDSVQYLIWRCGLVCYRFVYSGIETSGCETSRVQTVIISALGSYHRC